MRLWKVTRERQLRPESGMVLRLRARVSATQRPADKKAVERELGIGVVPEELTERKEDAILKSIKETLSVFV